MEVCGRGSELLEGGSQFDDGSPGWHSEAVPGSKQQTSPHGKDWARSLRCQSLLEKNPRVCARCHDDATCGH